MLVLDDRTTLSTQLSATLCPHLAINDLQVGSAVEGMVTTALSELSDFTPSGVARTSGKLSESISKLCGWSDQLTPERVREREALVQGIIIGVISTAVGVNPREPARDLSAMSADLSLPHMRLQLLEDVFGGGLSPEDR